MQASWAVSVALVLGWACLMGLLAQVRIPLPFTPVPFTMQVFGVLLGAIVLGRGIGTAAQAAYLGIGATGVPWFQGFNGGWLYLTGATAGYLVAFPLAALLVGTLAWNGGFRGGLRLVVPMTLGIAVIYALGMGWLMMSLGLTLERTFMAGVVPFVAVDVGKALLAAVVAGAVMPGRAPETFREEL